MTTLGKVITIAMMVVLAWAHSDRYMAQANHAGRCEAAPTYMLVPHWVENEICDLRDQPGFPGFSVTSISYLSEEGLVTYDAIYAGYTFIGMLVFKVNKHGKRRQLLAYSSATSDRTYYAPGAEETIEL